MEESRKLMGRVAQLQLEKATLEEKVKQEVICDFVFTIVIYLFMFY